jgi:hypothetical protein
MPWWQRLASSNLASATAVSCRTPAASAPVSHASRLYVNAAAHPRYGLPPIRSMK